MAGKNYDSTIAVACVLVVLAAAATPPVEGQLFRGLLRATACCGGGAGGVANVTGVLSCLNPITRTLAQVGNGISTANGTLAISVAPGGIVGGMLTGVPSGGFVPCVLTQTFQLVNQTLCPAINVVNTTLVGVTTLIRLVPDLFTRVTTVVLDVTNLINVGAGADV